MSNIAIIGSGSFGCALAQTLIKNNNIKVWSFKEEEAKTINEEHTCFFIKGSKLDEKIKCYTDYKTVIEDTDYIFIVTPSNVVRKTICDIKKYITNQKIIICSKGMEEETNKLLSEVVNEEIDNIVGVLSGPSIAKEIIENKKTSVVFASKSEELNSEIKDLFDEETFIIKTSTDVVGVEVGGALKNIGAIAFGLAEGLNLGENEKAALITEILEEISKIGVCLGGKKETFYGLSCLGDLIVTCSSNESRNHKAGFLLSKGKNAKEIKEEIGMVVEGLDNIIVAYLLTKKYEITAPEIEKLYNLIK